MMQMMRMPMEQQETRNQEERRIIQSIRPMSVSKNTEAILVPFQGNSRAKIGRQYGINSKTAITLQCKSIVKLTAALRFIPYSSLISI